LIAHYEKLDRPAATRNLLAAVEAAQQKIAANPAAGLPAPRVYPKLRKPGRRWVKSGRYWISYTETTPPIISGVFFETVDIPNWPSRSS
jgi:plasmid stabilization system protein ParE